MVHISIATMAIVNFMSSSAAEASRLINSITSTNFISCQQGTYEMLSSSLKGNINTKSFLDHETKRKKLH